MSHEEIAENLTFPIWRCLDSDFKKKYMSDTWGIFENMLKSAAYQENLIRFFDKLKRLLKVEWQHQFESQVLSVIESGQDEDILMKLRQEVSYIVLLTRKIHQERKDSLNLKLDLK